jgi:hypothetical protein
MKDSRLKFWIGKEKDPLLLVQVKVYFLIGFLIGVVLAIAVTQHIK